RSGVAGASALVAFLALLGAIGWLAGVPALTTLGTDARPIMLSGVAVLLAATVSLRMLASRKAHGWRWAVRLCALVILVVAVPGIALEEGWWSARGAAGIFKMPWLDWPPTSVGAASCYLLLAAAILLATLPGRRAWEWAQYFGAMVGGIALVALVGLT